MTADTISVNDRNSNEVKLATDFQDDKHVPIHQQDAAQHQAVLDALGAVETAVGGIGGASDPATGTGQTGTNSRLDDLLSRVGIVGASPASNTLGDRLKAIATALAGTLTVGTHAVTQAGSWVLSAGTAVIGKVGIDPAANTVVLSPGLDSAGNALPAGLDTYAKAVSQTWDAATGLPLVTTEVVTVGANTYTRTTTNTITSGNITASAISRWVKA